MQPLFGVALIQPLLGVTLMQPSFAPWAELRATHLRHTDSSVMRLMSCSKAKPPEREGTWDLLVKGWVHGSHPPTSKVKRWSIERQQEGKQMT